MMNIKTHENHGGEGESPVWFNRITVSLYCLIVLVLVLSVSYGIGMAISRNDPSFYPFFLLGSFLFLYVILMFYGVRKGWVKTRMLAKHIPSETNS